MEENLELSLEDVTCFRALVRHCRVECRDMEFVLDHELADSGVLERAIFSVKVYDKDGNDISFADGFSISEVVKTYFKNIGRH